MSNLTEHTTSSRSSHLIQHFPQAIQSKPERKTHKQTSISIPRLIPLSLTHLPPHAYADSDLTTQMLFLLSTPSSQMFTSLCASSGDDEIE